MPAEEKYQHKKKKDAARYRATRGAVGRVSRSKISGVFLSVSRLRNLGPHRADAEGFSRSGVAVDMKKDRGFVIGCFAFLYAMALLFIAAAWFGPPIGQHHGLREVFSRDQVYTTGKVIRFESFHVKTSTTSTPVVEMPVGKTLFRFKGEGMDSHPFDKGDMIPVAYPAGHPEKAYIRTFRQMYFGSLLMLLFASPFLALAGWGTIMQVRDRLRAPASNSRT